MMGRFLLALTDAIIGILEFLIGLRIILKFLGASTAASFVSWVYSTTQPLLAPFEGMFPTATIPAGRSVLEVSALIALLIYGFIGYLIESAIGSVTYYRTTYYRDDED